MIGLGFRLAPWRYSFSISPVLYRRSSHAAFNSDFDEIFSVLIQIHMITYLTTDLDQDVDKLVESWDGQIELLVIYSQLPGGQSTFNI